MLCWTAPMTGGNSWEVPPPASLSFNSPCNPLVDDAAGAMWWNARNSMRNYDSCGILSLGTILAWP